MYVSFSRYYQSFLVFEQHDSKMANNDYYQTLNNHGLSKDAQGRWWELLSPTQVLTGEALKMTKKRSKCHGNCKLQHFKRKCRARGLNEEQIAVLINTQNDTVCVNSLNNQTKQAFKRKRDLSQHGLSNSSMKSLSQLSISQPSTKKTKNNISQHKIASAHDNQADVGHVDDTQYKPSKHLRMPRKLLLRSLRLQLNSALKEQSDRQFLLARLELSDKKFCLDANKYLYQTYLDLGSRHNIWSVSVEAIIFIRLLRIDLF